MSLHVALPIFRRARQLAAVAAEGVVALLVRRDEQDLAAHQTGASTGVGLLWIGAGRRHGDRRAPASASIAGPCPDSSCRASSSDRKSTRPNSSHYCETRMPHSAYTTKHQPHK